MLVLTAAGGNTGWHYLITRHARYAPHLSNYSAAAGGRTFPSAAGFHTSELFFTNDDGVFVFAIRDAPALAERRADGSLPVADLVEAHRGRSEEHTSELQSRQYLVCRLLLEKKTKSLFTSLT